MIIDNSICFPDTSISVLYFRSFSRLKNNLVAVKVGKISFTL